MHNIQKVSDVVVEKFVLQFPYIPRNNPDTSVRIDIQMATSNKSTMFIEYTVHDCGIETIERRLQKDEEEDEDDSYFSLEIRLYDVRKNSIQKIRDYVKKTLCDIKREYGRTPSPGYFKFRINGACYKKDIDEL